MIDLIIPTMWKFKLFPHFLEKYVNYQDVKKIIIIDNLYQNKPKKLIENKKIQYCKQPSNIFVGPSWNIGVDRSSSDFICILNDDIFLQEDVLNFVLKQDFSKIDIIGSKIVHSNHNTSIEKISINKKIPLGSQFYNFGTCMFMKKEKYFRIPSLYKCWFTDDYLVHQHQNIYRISFSSEENSKYGSSNTVNTNNKTITNRIRLDCINAQKYLLSR
jgi:hypothetical protein